MPPLARTMATVSSREIAYQEEKPVLISKGTHHQFHGQAVAQAQLTSQPIIQLLAGQFIATAASVVSKGSLPSLQPETKSMTRSRLLQTKKAKPAEALFDEPAPKARKRVNSQEPERSPSKCKAKPSIALCLARGPGDRSYHRVGQQPDHSHHQRLQGSSH